MATNEIYVNTSQNVTSKAIVVSRNRPKRQANLPSLVIGSDRPINFFLIDDSGSFDPRSGASGYTIRMGAGPTSGTPDSGKSTLTDGVDTTGAISNDAGADVVESALNALNSNTGPYGDLVSVTSDVDGYYSLKFATVGAKTLLSGDAGGLTPESNVIVSDQVIGDGSTKAEQAIRLRRQPVIYTDTFAQITNGWTGVLSANNARALWLVASEGKGGTIVTDFEIELQTGSDTPEVIARGEIEISGEIINPSAFDPHAIPQPVFPTDSSFLTVRLDITGLTGGLISDLDSILTADLSTGRLYALGVSIGASVPGQLYVLKAGTDPATASNTVVRPLDYNATTNPKIWRAYSSI